MKTTSNTTAVGLIGMVAAIVLVAATVLFTGCASSYRMKAMRDNTSNFSKTDSIHWELVSEMPIEGRRLFTDVESILLEQGFHLKPANEATYLLRFGAVWRTYRNNKQAVINARLFRLVDSGAKYAPTSLWDAKILLPYGSDVENPDNALRTLLSQFGKEVKDSFLETPTGVQ